MDLHHIWTSAAGNEGMLCKKLAMLSHYGRTGVFIHKTGSFLIVPTYMSSSYAKAGSMSRHVYHQAVKNSSLLAFALVATRLLLPPVDSLWRRLLVLDFGSRRIYGRRLHCRPMPQRRLTALLRKGVHQTPPVNLGKKPSDRAQARGPQNEIHWR